MKLTKNELRGQQRRLAQLEKYLPTLQLKKAMLQMEVQKARLEILQLIQDLETMRQQAEEASSLLSRRTAINPTHIAKIKHIKKQYENYAGVEVPFLVGVDFEEIHYSLLETPPWVDGVIALLRDVAIARVKVVIAEEKKSALERELREVSIRVNLFEKVLIPRAKDNIAKIRVFLGDQELAAVGRAKVAKGKIEASKRKEPSYAY